MPDQLEDTQDLSGTQPITPPKNVPQTHVQPPAPRYERRPRKRKSNERSALYLPAWSVGLMLLLVFSITAAIVMLVITLGGQSAPGGEPRFVIITAAPTSTPLFVETPVPTSATSQPIQNFQGPVPAFALEGPTLPPIIHSPTPISINIGVTVIANTDELRIRPDPSLDNEQLFYAQEGDRFTVIEGPQQGSGLTWWKVQDPDDPDHRTGWAAADYLDVAIQ